MSNFQLSIPRGVAAPAFLAAGSAQSKEAFEAVFSPLVMDGLSQPRATQKQKLPSHFNLFEQGAISDSVYVIESGIVKLVHESGDEKSILGLRSRGCILEISSALLSMPCPCSGVTVTQTVVSRIPVEEFREALRCDANLLREVNRMLSREIYTGQEQEMELRSASVVERLSRLIREFRAFGAGSSPATASRTSIKQTEVAQMLAITPEHLSRLLKKMRPEVPMPASLPMRTF